MASGELDGKIERAKQELYDPSLPPPAPAHVDLSPRRIDVADDWGAQAQKAGRTPAAFRILRILAALAGVAALAALGFFAYTVLDPFATPSDTNISLTPVLAASTPSGVATPVALTLTNTNRVALEGVSLLVTYPLGTRDTNGHPLEQETRDLGAIPSGGIVSYDANPVFFSEEGVDRDVRFSLEYRFAGVASTFKKEEVRTIRVTAAPVRLSIETLKEQHSGQPLSVVISVRSNVSTSLENLVLAVDFPRGFALRTSDPTATFGNDGWRIGRLDPGEAFIVHLTGTLSGVDNEEKTFRATVGEESMQAERQVGNSYGQALATVLLKQPFIGVNLSFNSIGQDSSEVVAFGSRIRGDVDWENNLDAKILDAKVEVKLSGSALDRSSVMPASGGFYRATSDTIAWDKRGVPALAEISSGGHGRVSFSFLPLPSSVGRSVLRDPSVTAEITVRGTRLDASGVPQAVETVYTKTVKVVSEVQLAARAVHFVGPFTNRGSVPARAEQETTYTIIWTLVNSSNDLQNASVSAILPAGVRFTGSIDPLGAPIVYDRLQNRVTWTPGNIASGTGIATKPLEIAFQVALTPSISQVRQIPQLLGDQTFTAHDVYADTQISFTHGALDTSIPTDPKAGQDAAQVVP